MRTVAALGLRGVMLIIAPDEHDSSFGTSGIHVRLIAARDDLEASTPPRRSLEASHLASGPSAVHNAVGTSI